jgi:23S rRNA (guanosine2251-2'-O)-methyltransferase
MAPAGIGLSVEGVHAVTAAIQAGRAEEIIVEEGRLSALASIEELARQAGVAVRTVPDLSGIATTSSPQGVMARCRPLAPVSLEDGASRAEPAALVVLDHVEDPRNVGAIARSAAAFGIGGLVFSGRRSAPLGATAFKAAAGALESLALVRVSSVASAISDLRDLRIWTVGLEAGATDPITALELLSGPVALVVGAEGAGLSRLVKERVDVLASIPTLVESLNVSVAAGIAFYEMARVRGRV